MAETFRERDLRGADFESVDLTGATFYRTYLNGVTFRNVDMIGAKILNADLIDVEITAEIRNLTINGVDVTDYVEGELDRRYPGREKMRPTDPAGFREAWDLLEELWSGTVERARALEARRPGAIHESVDGEWSFVQTLRHLLFVTDSWVGRGILEVRDPWHRLGVPPTGMTRVKGLDDPDLRPSLDEVLSLRSERTATVERILTALTDEGLDEEHRAVGAGHPTAGLWPVRRCLTAVVTEEWRHRDYAERDLARL